MTEARDDAGGDDGRIGEEALAATAALLAQGTRLHLTSLALLLVIAVAASGARTSMAVGLATAAVVIAGLETYLAVRVGLDARLFGRLAEDARLGRLDMTAFDAGLVRSRLVAAPPRERTLANRTAGARRLLTYQAAASLSLAGLAVAALAVTVPGS